MRVTVDLVPSKRESVSLRASVPDTRWGSQVYRAISVAQARACSHALASWLRLALVRQDASDRIVQISKAVDLERVKVRDTWPTTARVYWLARGVVARRRTDLVAMALGYGALGGDAEFCHTEIAVQTLLAFQAKET